MQLNVTVNLGDDASYELHHEIIEESARQLIKEQLYNRIDGYGKTYRDAVNEYIKKILLDIVDTDFKNDIKNNVVEDISKKYLRTKQYKEIQDEFKIDRDTIIKSGLHDIISEMVGKELNRRLKG
jgi:hypothetical protein